MLKKIVLIVFFIFSVGAKELDPTLLDLFKVQGNSQQIKVLQKKMLSLGGKAVPYLIEVMKSSAFPDKSRWVATFLLARIMGKKSINFLAKFLEHPSWIMRMASLKALLGLKARDLGDGYSKALKDKSLVVRSQALENIRILELEQFAPQVWAMLYDDRNYHHGENGLKKRGNIIKKIIRVIGDLKFKKAKIPLLKMVQKKKYQDIFDDVDYSLAKILGKSSPSGGPRIKRYFWKRVAMAEREF
jgi:hypothetical protein